jgi:hypothetical protein
MAIDSFFIGKQIRLRRKSIFIAKKFEFDKRAADGAPSQPEYRIV